MHPLDPAISKLKRADVHISALESAIETFLQSNPYRFEGKVNKKKTKEVWSVVVDPIPWQLDAIAADAVHNLRTPLDKMLASGFRNPVIHTPKSSIQKIKFPGVQHPNELNGVLAELRTHLTTAVIDFIASTEPYIGGAGQAICIINLIDNRDKHRALLEPMKSGFHTSGMEGMKVRRGNLFRVGSPRGSSFVTDRYGNLFAESESKGAILRRNEETGKYYLEFKSAHNDMEMFTLSPGADFEVGMVPHLNVTFQDAGYMEGQPVVDALRAMHDSVSRIVAAFRAKFF